VRWSVGGYGGSSNAEAEGRESEEAELVVANCPHNSEQESKRKETKNENSEPRNVV
jgi:hypothetical protein